MMGLPWTVRWRRGKSARMVSQSGFADFGLWVADCGLVVVVVIGLTSPILAILAVGRCRLCEKPGWRDWASTGARGVNPTFNRVLPLLHGFFVGRAVCPASGKLRDGDDKSIVWIGPLNNHRVSSVASFVLDHLFLRCTSRNSVKALRTSCSWYGFASSPSLPDSVTRSSGNRGCSQTV